MPQTLNRFCKVFFFLLITNTTNAQKKEEQDLNDAFNNLSAYNLGKLDSLPRNAPNYYKVMGRVDDAFTRFILHPNSQAYEKFKLAQGSTNFRFFRLANTREIDAFYFTADSTDYVVFGYTIQDGAKYFIKRLHDNCIVYSGDKTVGRIDGLYALDKNHMLLIEEYGNYNSGRRASVVAKNGNEWKQIEAFKGLAFGKVQMEYTKRKFVAKRPYFHLMCDMESLMSSPQDINKIFYNEATKTLSYKQYSNNRQFKMVEAAFANGMFAIDDYQVGSTSSDGGVAVPQ